MPACFPVRWGRWLLLKEGQKISSGKSQWIEIQSSASGISEWWIKREDVVLSSEMKAYNKPLPVKSFRYDAGHLRMHFEFLKSGEAYVHWKGKKDVAQIFYAPDVLEVRYPAPTYEYSEIIGFKNDKVYPTTCVTGELCEVLYH